MSLLSNDSGHRPLFLNTVLLGGSTEDKLQAASAAGFDQVELWRQDVEDSDAPLLPDMLGGLNLGLTDIQVLLDFDGAPDDKREAKRREALELLDLGLRVGAGTLLAPASTDPDCVAERVVEDLRWLAEQAAQRGMRLAYEGMAWSTLHNTIPAVWSVLEAVAADNTAIVVDAFHLFARDRTAEDLHGIPPERIALVQLSDVAAPIAEGQLIQTARHHRALPGSGIWPLRSLLGALQQIGYRGPIGLEVFNDELRAGDPFVSAAKAMQALQQVGA